MPKMPMALQTNRAEKTENLIPSLPACFIPQPETRQDGTEARLPMCVEFTQWDSLTREEFLRIPLYIIADPKTTNGDRLKAWSAAAPYMMKRLPAERSESGYVGKKEVAAATARSVTLNDSTLASLMN